MTGATSGIGLATAELFAREGACVSIVGHDEEHGKAALERVRAQHAEAVFAQADVADPAQAEAAVRKTVEQWGKIDVLVNDAAMMTFAPVVELSPDDWDRVLAVNLRGVFLFAKFSIPHMPPGSSIVNVSSVHAHETTVNVAPYAASKGGMEAFSRALSRELGAKKIRVNCVAPGAVDTPMLWSNPNVRSGREKVQGAIGAPDDIAAAIAFLAADEARFVNGTTLVVDGGRLDIL
ncbi:MAG: SDR family oxidoreductase [Chloroflexota bacterium]|nr:SDR family oxidoreductase [Chloroflexota bacterium]